MRKNTFYTTGMDNFSLPNKGDALESIDEIEKDIIHFITFYKKGKITLKKLIRLIEKIKTENKYELPHDLQNIINEICSLSVIDDILMDLLNELKTSKKI